MDALSGWTNFSNYSYGILTYNFLSFANGTVIE